ncbi:MAG: hypothetical protein ACYSWQ_10270, partial [Planctomycetota bacterium]
GSASVCFILAHEGLFVMHFAGIAGLGQGVFSQAASFRPQTPKNENIRFHLFFVFSNLSL